MSKQLNAKRNASLRVSEAMGLISRLIHVGQFEVDAAQVLDDHHMDVYSVMSDSAEDIAKEMNTNVETVKQLEKTCSASSLHCPREDEADFSDVQAMPKHSGLKTLASWRKANIERNHNINTYNLKSKYTEFSCLLEIEGRKKKPKNKGDVIRSPETIITVAVNFPRSMRRFKHCAVDFRVLGSQKLSELRDKIPCVIDDQPFGNFTENPDHPRDIKCKDIFKSGFFFIENTFFDDNRCSENTNLSKHIIDWAENSDITLPPNTRCLSMEDYTFADLDLRLGSPYLYMHQGDCEHVLIFKDIRILHPDDCKARSAYPLPISRAKFRTTICKVCHFFHACWMTRFDQLSDEDPSFFCDSCFRMFHYREDGSKVAEFEAYPFINREELTY